MIPGAARTLSEITTHSLVLLSWLRIPAIPEPSWELSATDNAIRIDLLKFAGSFFWKALVSSAIVVIGVALEGPELLHELWPKAFAIFAKRWVKKAGLIGWLFVVLGVGGEVVFGLLENKAQDLLQTFDEIILLDTQRSAGSAKASAIEAANAASLANSESAKATSSSANAMALARGARKEADSFGRDIASATEQAAKAENDLASALNEANTAQQELDRIRTPRSLRNIPGMISELSRFKGTTYVFASVFQDDDSTNLVRQIDDLLQKSGWVRGPSLQGFPGVNWSKNGKVILSAPIGFNEGIRISTESLEETSVLQSRKLADLPQYLQAAVSLKSNLTLNVTPFLKGNVEQTLYADKGTSITVKISVGEKPLQ